MYVRTTTIVGTLTFPNVNEMFYHGIAKPIQLLSYNFSQAMDRMANNGFHGGPPTLLRETVRYTFYPPALKHVCIFNDFPL